MRGCFFAFCVVSFGVRSAVLSLIFTRMGDRLCFSVHSTRPVQVWMGLLLKQLGRAET